MIKKITKTTETQRKAYGACQHNEVSYKALEKMNKKCFSVITRLSKDIESKNKLLGDYREGQIILIKRLEENGKEIETVTRERNDSVRAYQGLHSLGKFAEELGIDIKSEKLPENMKDYKFQQQSKLLESGKVSHRLTVKSNGKNKNMKWFKNER